MPFRSPSLTNPQNSSKKRFSPKWSRDISLKLAVYICAFVGLVFVFHYLLFRTPQQYPTVRFVQRAGEYALPNKYEYGIDSYIPKGLHEVSYQEECRDRAGSMQVNGHASDWWFYMPQYGGFVNEVNAAITTDNLPLARPFIPIRHGSCY